MKAIREALGCTQEQFASRIGVTSMTVSRWERGVAPPTLTIPQAKALSRELRKIGMTIENLPDSFAPMASRSA